MLAQRSSEVGYIVSTKKCSSGQLACCAAAAAAPRQSSEVIMYERI